MKIIIKAEVSLTRSSSTVDLEVLRLTKQEWDDLPEDKKQAVLQEYYYSYIECPYWIVNNWSVEKK